MTDISKFKQELGIQQLPFYDAGQDSEGNSWVRSFLNEDRLSILMPRESFDKILEDPSMPLIKTDKGEKTSQTGRKYSLVVLFVPNEKPIGIT